MAERRYDLRVFHKDQNGSPARLRLGFLATDGRGAAVAGAEKLRQRVQIKLLTGKGTRRFLPNDGCQFINDLRRGALRTSADVVRSFAAAAVDLRRLLKAEDEPGTPDDERLKDVVLDRVAVSEAGDAVFLHIKVVSQSGETTADVAAVPIVPKGA